jgi:hypothetical protein
MEARGMRSPKEYAKIYIKGVIKCHPGIKIRSIFADDVEEKSIELCENKRYKAELIEHIKLIDSSQHANGRYLYPEKIDGDHFVVVSCRRVANLEYISTLAHECQHAIDLIGYCKDKCDGDFNKLLDEEMQREIFLWSEFNARKTGHRTYWLKIEKEIQRHTDASIEEKMRRNLSEMFHRMNIYLSEGAGDSCLDDIVHELVGYFARISMNTV